MRGPGKQRHDGSIPKVLRPVLEMKPLASQDPPFLEPGGHFWSFPKSCPIRQKEHFESSYSTFEFRAISGAAARFGNENPCAPGSGNRKPRVEASRVPHFEADFHIISDICHLLTSWKDPPFSSGFHEVKVSGPRQGRVLIPI